MIADGVNGTISFDGRFVILKRKLFFGKSKGEKSIDVASITAVQFKEPGLTSGFIQIVFSGSGESKGGVFDAAKDENSIMFTNRSKAKFTAVRDAIRAAVAKPVSAPSQSSIVDQLSALAELHRAGALTDDQFEMAKDKLIGG